MLFRIENKKEILYEKNFMEKYANIHKNKSKTKNWEKRQ